MNPYAVTLTATPKMGSLILLEFLTNGTGTLNSVADDVSNTWTLLAGPVATAGTVVRVYQYWAVNTGGLASGQHVTCTTTVGTGVACVANLRELYCTTTDKNATQVNSPTSTNAPTGTTAATTTPIEIVWESIACSATNTTWTPDSSFITTNLFGSGIIQSGSGGRTLLSAYQDISATGTQHATNTGSLGTSALTATIISTFKVRGSLITPARTATNALLRR